MFPPLAIMCCRAEPAPVESYAVNMESSWCLPADSPQIVTLSGSPPKSWIYKGRRLHSLKSNINNRTYFCVHSRANVWSTEFSPSSQARNMDDDSRSPALRSPSSLTLSPARNPNKPRR